MPSRTDLQDILETLAATVYFQPPESVKLSYPCIVYSRSSAKTAFADDNPYSYENQYQVTVIDKDPDSGIPEKVAMLPKCTHVRTYVSDNLHHDVFTLFY